MLRLKITENTFYETIKNGFDIVFIENVSNLVCPATFDLGGHFRVVLLPVPEGSDKPVKYPRAFLTSQIFVVTKTDLLPYFDFFLEEVKSDALGVNPSLQILSLSAKSGERGSCLDSLVAGNGEGSEAGDRAA